MCVVEITQKKIRVLCIKVLLVGPTVQLLGGLLQISLTSCLEIYLSFRLGEHDKTVDFHNGSTQ